MPTQTRVLAVVAPAMLLVALTSDMVTPMLPTIGARFGATDAQLAWVVTGFLLVFAIGIPVYGRAADAVGVRTLFGGGLLVFVAGALVCALAPSLPVLVAGRVLTGAGAAAIPVLGVVVVTRMLPAGRRGVGIGTVSAAGGAGAALGPAVGGGVGQLLGWPALFWVTAVYALLVLAGVRRVIPASAPAGRLRFDLAGGLLLGATVGLFLFGVTAGQGSGFAAPAAWGALAAAAVAALLFGWRTAVADDPFVPPSLLRERTYTGAVAVVFLAMVVNLSVLTFVPALVIGTGGLTPAAASLVMVPGGLALAAVSPVAGRLAGRVGPRVPAVAGLVLLGLSAFGLSVVAGSSAVLTAVGVVGVGAGFGIVVTSVTDLAAGALPAERTGVGLGIFQGAQFLGAGAGPALAGALLDARRGAGAVNPLHLTTSGAPFSDAFLALTPVALLAAAVVVVTARFARAPARTG